MEPVKTKELRGWVGPVEMKLGAWAGPAKKGELGGAMDLAKFFSGSSTLCVFGTVVCFVCLNICY